LGDIHGLEGAPTPFKNVLDVSEKKILGKKLEKIGYI